MVANWKALTFGFVGMASFAWLGPTRDSAKDLSPSTEFAMNNPGACTRHGSSRCMVDVRYAYPAAALYLVPEDSYF